MRGSRITENYRRAYVAPLVVFGFACGKEHYVCFGRVTIDVTLETTASASFVAVCVAVEAYYQAVENLGECIVEWSCEPCIFWTEPAAHLRHEFSVQWLPGQAHRFSNNCKHIDRHPKRAKVAGRHLSLYLREGC